MENSRKPRVLIAKVGLDGHDRGAKLICLALMKAGMDVIYAGLRQQPKQIVMAAIQESVDIIGLSILSGAHLALTREVMACLKRFGGEGIQVVVGGIIPDRDVDRLKQMGVKEVFNVVVPLTEVPSRISKLVVREHELAGSAS